MQETTNMCPKFEAAIKLLSQKWNALIINHLLQNNCERFCNIESAIGISGRMLSERLKELEKKGLVERKVIPETPVRVEYSLTEKGLALEPILKEIQNWSTKWVEITE